VLGMVVRDPHRAGCRLQLRRVDPTEIPVHPPLRKPPHEPPRKAPHKDTT
jgi:hypothetical protein